nr:dynamin-related protein 4c [Quercus suber]
MEEIMVLEEAKGIGLPNFLPRTAFLTILQKKVKGISSIPISFAEKVWNYVEEVVISVKMQHSENYYQLQLSFRRAGHNLIAKMKEHSVNWVMEIVEMEKLTDYTCNPEYLSAWKTLMSQQDAFMKDVLINEERPAKIKLNSFGEIEVGKLRMLEESPAVAAKRPKINKSIQLLKKSKEVAKIMDKVGTYAD